MAREILIEAECLQFLRKQEQRVTLKFWYLIDILQEFRMVHSHFLKKVKGSTFYELRIKVSNQYRFLIKPIDNADFTKCTKAICLFGFIKKSNKDYPKAIKGASSKWEIYIKSLEQ